MTAQATSQKRAATPPQRASAAAPSASSGRPSLLSDRKDDGCLAEVEAVMIRLARGAWADVLGPIVCEHLGTGGKRLRARLALAATEALGRPRAEAIGWAAACELGHNATLVHDDLQDGDTSRRGSPTTWVRYGMAQAINAGDLMLMLPFLAIQQVEASQAVLADLCSVWAERLARVVRGQADELDMTQRGIVDRDRYTRAVAGKTGALFRLPVEGAALVAGATRLRAQAIAAPFETLGVVFQLQDDVLDLYGDKGREAPGSDLREGKISGVVVEHLDLHPGDRDWLLALLKMPREQTPDDQVAAAIARFRDGGALKAVVERLHREVDSACNADVLKEDQAIAQLMAELVDVILRPIASVL